MTRLSNGNGHAAVSIGLMLHLAPDTQIYCELYGDQPPALVIGTEPADCVISSANFEAEPMDLIAADRLVKAAIEFRDEMRRQVTRNRAEIPSARPEALCRHGAESQNGDQTPRPFAR